MKRLQRPTARWADVVLLGGSFVVVVLCGVLADLSLRQWSAMLGAVAFGGIVYQSLATWHAIDRLAKALAVTLAVTLFSSALAQYLLIASDHLHPPNRLGLSFIIVARVACLVLVLAWGRLVHVRART